MSRQTPFATVAIKVGQLRIAIREANEEIRYWQRQKALRERPDAKAEAGARVLVWQSTLAAREAELDALRSTV